MKYITLIEVTDHGEKLLILPLNKHFIAEEYKMQGKARSKIYLKDREYLVKEEVSTIEKRIIEGHR
jgi:hypothetical protein